MEPTTTEIAKTLARLGFAKDTFMRFAKCIDYNLLETPEITGIREVTYRLKNVHDLMDKRTKEKLETNELVIVKLEELYKYLQNAFETAGEIQKDLTGVSALKITCNNVRTETKELMQLVLRSSKLHVSHNEALRKEAKGGN